MTEMNKKLSSEIGLKCLDFQFGGDTCWYRDIDNVEDQISTLGLPDDASLWGWGNYKKSLGDFSEQIRTSFAKLTTEESVIAGEQIDAIIVCAPCRASVIQFLSYVKLDVAPTFNISAGDIHLIEGFDCVNLIGALDKAAQLINDGHKNVLVLAAERVESDRRRLRKYAIFSDACFSMIVSSDLGDCDYELVDIHVEADQCPPESTDGILSRELDKTALQSFLKASGACQSDIEKCFYINLYKPISDMKLLDMGFSRRQLYQDMIQQVGHCYGIDPFWSMVSYDTNIGSLGSYMLSASSKGHVGMALVEAL
jgi:3-oxoacyl-[acyl-carrier-protein] synthase-3